MSDSIETGSNVAGLSGVSTRIIDKFVATQAAINVLGSPTDAYSIKSLRKALQGFIELARTTPDRELRRRVVLMVTEGRAGRIADSDPTRVRNLVEEIYKEII